MEGILPRWFEVSNPRTKKHMGITRISNLFASNIDSVPAVTPSRPVTAEATRTQETQEERSDAVVLSKNLQSTNRAILQDAASARAARVAQLKDQVNIGSYKLDREQVAISLLRDLA